MDNKKFQEMIDEFTLDSDAIKDVAASFRYDIEHGVKETGESSLRMLPSYIGLPTGKETGEYLALDFGGTNLRVVLIRLDGEGKFEVIKKVAKPLVVPGEYDFICADANADELFDFTEKFDTIIIVRPKYHQENYGNNKKGLERLKKKVKIV